LNEDITATLTPAHSLSPTSSDVFASKPLQKQILIHQCNPLLKGDHMKTLIPVTLGSPIQTFKSVTTCKILETALAACRMQEAAITSRLKAKKLALAARGDVLYRLRDTNWLRSISETANFLEVKKTDLYHYLDKSNWIRRDPQSHRPIASQGMVRAGYLAQKVRGCPGGDGGEEPYGSVMVTAKGVVYLAEILVLAPEVQE